jgi:GNAT superfamily N-acetyltransferase
MIRCLGVDPPAQRTGVARGLLTPRLAQCDEARAPAALTSGEANVACYAAFGYTATRKIEASGNGPTHRAEKPIMKSGTCSK